MAMQKIIGNYQDSRGNAIPGATITVYDTGTTDMSTIYSDEGVTAKANPFTSDTDGVWWFYADDADYDIKMEKSGYSTRTLIDIQALSREGVKTGLANLTGYDYIQATTPSATGAGEYWLDTSTGIVYLSTGSGTGNWSEQYRIIVANSDNNYSFNNQYRIQDQTTLNGQPNPYYSFNGDDYLEATDDPDLDLSTNDFTVYPPGFKRDSAPSANEVIYAKRNGTSTGLQVYISTDGKLNCVYDDGTTDFVISSDSSVCNGKIHYPGVKGDRDGDLSMALDGKIQADTIAINATDISTATNLFFGSSSVAADFFSGSLYGKPSIFNYLHSDDVLISRTATPQMAIDAAYEGASQVAKNVSTCVNNGYDTFSGASVTGFTAVKTTTGTGQFEAGTADEINFVKGKKYRVLFSIVLNSGTMPGVTIARGFGQTVIAEEGTVTPSAGDNVLIFTSTEDRTGVAEFNTATGDVSNFVVSSLAVTQIGCIAEWKGQDVAKNGLWRESQNDNHAVENGVTANNVSEQLTEERGTWTGSVLLGGASTGIVIASQNNRYIKKGSEATVFYRISADKGGTSTGALTVTGAPFTAKDNTSLDYIGIDDSDRVGAAGEVTKVRIEENTTTLAFFQNPQGTGANSATDDTDLVATGTDFTLEGSITYETDE